MAGYRIPLAEIHLEPEEIERVTAVYRSGWLTMGPRVERLERAVAEYLDVPHALAVSSGTAALQLCALALELGADDEFVLPSITFVATASAIAATGARPVFVDIADRRRPWPSVEAYADAIGPRTRAIVSMPYGGHPAETEALAQLARDRSIALIEDAAHGLGALAADRRVGAFGTLAAFSFFSNKNVPAGEGGMVICHDAATAEEIRLLRSHGMTTTTWDRTRGRGTTYDVVRRGFNFRLDEPRAELALSGLERLEERIELRARVAERYRAALADLDGVEATAAAPAGSASAHHLFTAVLADGIDRDAVRLHMADRGVETSVHYPPIHTFAPFREGQGTLPLSEDYARTAITLPLYPRLAPQEQDVVVDALRSAIGVKVSAAAQGRNAPPL
jgi:dTDP-4-amino-4,6-dideoxygalactose transaminase